MLNKIMVQGRIANSIELRHTKNDTPICSFGLAWNEKSKNKETTCFFNCISYNHNAEFISKYFKKGDPIIIIGKLLVRKYTDSNNQNKSVAEIIVDSIEFNLNSSNNSNHSNNSKNNNDIEYYSDGNLPF